MRQRLVNLLACPECGSTQLDLEVFERTDEEIMSGVFRCRDCRREFPIIAGVPRFLPDALLATLSRYHPDYFAHYRVALPAKHEDSAVSRTLDFFTMQRPELHDAQLAPALTTYLERNLDVRIPGARSFNGKFGLDAGGGEGRYSYVLTRYGAEVVSMDLGNSVDFAFRRLQATRAAHVVQASIYQPPFRSGIFDFVMSIGVLHHLPDPHAGFDALTRLVLPDGTMHVWVYGLQQMSAMYRLSHLTTLRRLTSGLSPRSTYLLSLPIAAALEALLFWPSRALRQVPVTRDRVDPQVAEIASLPFSVVAAEVHDRIGAPVTHFPTAEEVGRWYREAGFQNVVVQQTPGGRGWSGCGSAPSAVSLLSR